MASPGWGPESVPASLLSLKEEKNFFLILLEKALSAEATSEWINEVREILSNIHFIEGPLTEKLVHACMQFLVPKNGEPEIGTVLERLSIVLYFTSVSKELVAELDIKMTEQVEDFPQGSVLSSFGTVISYGSALGTFTCLEVQPKNSIIETFTFFLVDKVNFYLADIPHEQSELFKIKNIIECLYETEDEELLFTGEFYTFYDTKKRFSSELKRLLTSEVLSEQIVGGALLGSVAFHRDKAFPSEFYEPINNVILCGNPIQAARLTYSCLQGLVFSAKVLRDDEDDVFADEEISWELEEDSLVTSFIDSVQRSLEDLSQDLHTHTSLRKFLVEAVLANFHDNETLHTQSVNFDLTENLTLEDFKELLRENSLVADSFCRYGIFKGMLSVLETTKDEKTKASLLECLKLGLIFCEGTLSELTEQIQAAADGLGHNPTLRKELESLFICAINTSESKGKTLLIKECITKLSNQVNCMQLCILAGGDINSAQEIQKLLSAIDLFSGISIEDLQEEKLLTNVNMMRYYFESLKESLNKREANCSPQVSELVKKLDECILHFDDILSFKK